MVNTGNPSNACFECKKRRIKCDGGKPECDKCIKAKHIVQCPGYPDKIGFKFREETGKVKERALKRQRKPIQPEATPAGDSGTVKPTPEIEKSAKPQKLAIAKQAPREPYGKEVVTLPHWQSKWTLSIPHISVGNALTQGAISSFMSQWSTPDPELFWASFDGAALLYPTAHLSTCYMSALGAVALITLSCHDKDTHTDLRRPAMKAYGQSLALINKTLEDPTQRTIDHTFMAIELIILFELLESGLHSEFIGPRYGNLGEFNHKVDRVLAHLRGIMAVVSIRGREQFSDSLGRRLFLTACVIWNLGSISMPEPLQIPLKSTIWEDLFHYDLGTYSDTYRLLPLQDRAIAVRKRAMDMFESQPSLKETAEILHHVQAVDKDLVAWHADLPDQWTMRVDMYAVFTFNLWRSYRIFMQDLVVSCLRRISKLLTVSYDNEIVAATDLSKALLDQICGSTPYSFADDEPKARIRGITQPEIPRRGVTVVFHLMFSFPLLVASMVAPVSEVQRKGIEEARLECARACGLIRPIRSYPRTLLKSVDDP